MVNKVNKDISLTARDFSILSNFVGELHRRVEPHMLDIMMGEIGSMTVWDRADLSVSEEIYGNPCISGSKMLCIKDNKLHQFLMVDKEGYKGALIYITKNSPDMPMGSIGKFYRVFGVDTLGNVLIRVIDAHSDCPDRFISLEKKYYSVLEENPKPKNIRI